MRFDNSRLLVLQKNAYEWGLESIPHTAEAIQVTQSVANFFIKYIFPHCTDWLLMPYANGCTLASYVLTLEKFVIPSVVLFQFFSVRRLWFIMTVFVAVRRASPITSQTQTLRSRICSYTIMNLSTQLKLGKSQVSLMSLVYIYSVGQKCNTVLLTIVSTPTFGCPYCTNTSLSWF